MLRLGERHFCFIWVALWCKIVCMGILQVRTDISIAIWCPTTNSNSCIPYPWTLYTPNDGFTANDSSFFDMKRLLCYWRDFFCGLELHEWLSRQLQLRICMHVSQSFSVTTLRSGCKRGEEILAPCTLLALQSTQLLFRMIVLVLKVVKQSSSVSYGLIHTLLFGAQLYDNETHVPYDS